MRPVVRAVSLLALVGAGALALRLFAPELLEPRAALEGLRGLSPPAQVVGYVLAYFVVTTLAVPAFVMAVVAGVAWGLPWGLLLCYLGATVSSNLHFFIGRALGAERIAAWLARKGFEQRFDKNTLVAMLVLRAMPAPFLVPNLTAGAAGVRWPVFFFGSGLGLVPQVTAFTVLSAQLYAGVEGAHTSAVAWGAGGITLLLGSALFSRWARNRLRAPP